MAQPFENQKQAWPSTPVVRPGPSGDGHACPRYRLRRSVLVVDRVPRARPRDGAVRRGSRDEGCEERDAEHI